MTDYPDERTCDNCGQTIFVYYSKKRSREYSRDSMKFINYDDGEKPDYHKCPNWKAGMRKTMIKKKKQKPIITPPAPPPEEPKPQKETIDEYLEPKYTSADQVTVVRGKVTEIITSRTVSYKYGLAKEYSTEKEEIMESFTYGTRTEVDSSLEEHDFQTLQTQALQHVNHVIHEQFSKHLNYRLIEQTGLIRK